MADPGPSPGESPADVHAGRLETSIQLSLGSDRVRLGLAEAGNTAPIAELMPKLRTSGVRGEPERRAGGIWPALPRMRVLRCSGG